MPENPLLVTEANEHASVIVTLANSDLIISRAKKGVASKRKCTTPQDDVGSDSRSELLTKPVAIVEGKLLGLEKCFDEMNKSLERVAKPRSRG